MNKEELRREMLIARNALSEQQHNLLSNTIADTFLESSIYQKATYIYAYAFTNNEVDLTLIINKALNDGKIVALPCSYMSNGIPKMEFYEISSVSDLSPGYKGILEPDRRKAGVKKPLNEPDVVLVPGVCFDYALNRIGYGKGFYDRYLVKHESALRVGLAFNFQIVEQLPADVNDVKMDIIITENGAFFYE